MQKAIEYSYPEDFEGLDELPEDIQEKVKQARIEARDIIARLEPRHITGWPSLLEILRSSLSKAETTARTLYGVE